MIPNGLVHYTAGDIERLSVELLKSRPDVDFEPPINLEWLIENAKDIRLELDDELFVRHRVEGCVCKRYMSRELTIYVDTSICSAASWIEYSEVLGEEFAHAILHQALIHMVNTKEDFIELQSDPEWPRYERDAKAFGLAIRMPAELVVREAERIYPRVVDEYGFGDFMQVEMQMRNRLATRFRASPQEAQRRISSWQCNIRNRLVNSVQTQSNDLVPNTWILKAEPPLIQKPLFFE